MVGRKLRKKVSRELVARHLGMRKKELARVKDQFVDELSKRIDEEAGFEELAREQQSKAVINEKKLAEVRFEGLIWRLQSIKPTRLIFGDSGPLAYDYGQESYVPVLFASKENVDHVVFPISPDFLLIGDGMEQRRRIPLDVQIVNLCIAELSQEFVVSQDKGTLDGKIVESLGRKADVWRDYLPEEAR